MNLLEVWIGDLVKTEKVVIDRVEKVKVYFKTVCWGCREVNSSIFDSIEDWKKSKAQKYYLG